MNDENSLGIGLIGCGAFGKFCMEVFREVPAVRIVAVADVVKDAADALAKELGVEALYDPQELIARDDVNVVHVATPPSTHYELLLAAVSAGKHVLCEKPLAMNVTQADEMLAAAGRNNVIAPVNFVLRYNAATELVKSILDSGVMGRPLAARLTNCAADSNLPVGHWFWDKDLSGGIFIEHGVHFFDLYSYWFGPGCVIDAHTEKREGTGQEDRVMCTIRHDGGTVASHYHAFDQAAMMDRTDHRIICELGDIRVDGWIPLTVSIDAVADEKGAEELISLMDGAENSSVEDIAEGLRNVVSRGVQRSVSRRLRITLTPNADKQSVYAGSVRALFEDQLAAIRDRSHARIVTEKNGRDAVALAESAVRLADPESEI